MHRRTLGLVQVSLSGGVGRGAWGVGRGGGGTADPPATAPCGRRCPVVLVVSRGALPDSRACPGLSLAADAGSCGSDSGVFAAVTITDHSDDHNVNTQYQLGHA